MVEIPQSCEQHVMLGRSSALAPTRVTGDFLPNRGVHVALPGEGRTCTGHDWSSALMAARSFIAL